MSNDHVAVGILWVHFPGARALQVVSWHERVGNHQRVQGGNSKGHNSSAVGKCQTHSDSDVDIACSNHMVRTANLVKGKRFHLTFLWVRPLSTARTLCISAADGSGFQLCMLYVFAVVCHSIGRVYQEPRNANTGQQWSAGKFDCKTLQDQGT